MAITLVGSSSAAGASVTATTASVTVPTGSAGDLLLIGVAASTNTTSGADAPLITSSSAALTQIGEINETWLCAVLFYRFVQTGDASSYTFTLSAAAPETIVCVRYSGVDSLRFWATDGSTGATTETSTSVAFATGGGNVQSTDVVVAFAAMARNTQAASVTTISTPSGWVQNVTNNGPLAANANGATAALFDKLAAADTPTVTGDAGHWFAEAVVLAAASNPLPDAPGGAISFVNASTAAVTSAGPANIVVNTPSGVVDGDVLLLALASTFLGVDTPPAGWTLLSFANGSYAHGTVNNAYDVTATLWYKVASGEGSSYTIGLTTTQVTCAAIVAYRGVRAAPLAKVGETHTDQTGATSTSPAPYALPQTVASNLVVNFYTAGSDANPGTSSVTGPSGTWTQRAQVATSVASNPASSITIADELGATDQPTASASTVQAWGVFSVALVGTPLLAASRSLVAPFALKRSTQY